ncbi:MAG: DUF488 family protein [Acetobacteraceae bacterium]
MQRHLPFYTVGHSTRSVEELVALVRVPKVDLIVDVRTVPRSRTNPQFNTATLPDALAPYGIGYCHLGNLGGLRSRRRGAAPSPNGWWQNASFRNYADYTATSEFREGLAELRELGREHIACIMCAEAVWWRCHRRIIADYLLASGEEVFHLVQEGKIGPARMTPGAVPQADGTLIYPLATS